MFVVSGTDAHSTASSATDRALSAAVAAAVVEWTPPLPLNCGNVRCVLGVRVPSAAVAADVAVVGRVGRDAHVVVGMDGTPINGKRLVDTIRTVLVLVDIVVGLAVVVVVVLVVLVVVVVLLVVLLVVVGAGVVVVVRGVAAGVLVAGVIGAFGIAAGVDVMFTDGCPSSGGPSSGWPVAASNTHTRT